MTTTLTQLIGATGFIGLLILYALGRDVDPLLMAGSLALLTGGTVQDAVKGVKR